ncbi:F0F1 ATP synthase subunit delta [Aquabacterium sp.]|uniref:F0F1 ATP synthase subunit delta n=1 Tax=Aquabacterium sp. TaxID=1872578 RepID=UPI002CE35093|nr:F0F1 ATP synthase subunit delta [Aquabacterium sp.]HSW08138.1 F0F1 ATP synthase subunit delta [Aquabacterium sp.]
MAELATIARPYAEALFKSAGSQAATLAEQLTTLGSVAGNPALRQFADNPKVAAPQVFEVITGVAKTALDSKVSNLLQAVIENGRLAALPEIAAQFKALVNAQSGSSDAIVYSAYAIDDAALADVVASLEKRFGRKLNVRVEIDAELIGGIRVVVGDEVLDTSVKARLEQMKVALTA